jgi:hypothetical protein
MLVPLIGCTDSGGPSGAPTNQLPSLSVSSPVNLPASGGADLVVGTAWVSLPPGAVPNGVTATIRDGRSGASLSLAMVDGGFDPVAIGASVGDTLFVTVTRAGNATPITGYQVVAAGRPPTVVRTTPAPGKRDVPLNAAIVVVFSAPIDSTTLNAASFGVTRGGQAVGGSVRRIGPYGFSAEFYPDSLLAPSASYVLFLTQAIHGENGVPLAAAVSQSFFTGTVSQDSAVGGQVSGLLGSGLVVNLNGVEDLPVAGNGPFTFSTQLAPGAAISITVRTLPANPSQLCAVAQGVGTMTDGSYTTAVVTCSTSNSGATGRILFSSTDGGTAEHLFVVDLDHSSITQLTSGPCDDGGSAWSPDRTKIAFLREGASCDGTSSGVWVMNSDGSQPVNVIPLSRGWGAYFAWSPDGSRLAVSGYDSVRIARADGSGLVSTGAIAVAPEQGCMANLSWSPDGATLAGSCSTETSDGSLFTQAYLVNPDGSGLRRLTSTSTYGMPGTEFAEGPPSWSPSGSKVLLWTFAFGVTVMNGDGSGAYSVSGDSPNLQGIPSVGFFSFPDWSPDGKWIAYTNNSSQLVIAPLANAGPATVVTGITGGARFPAWAR